MRTIEYTTKFKRDYKRESKGIYKHILISDLRLAIHLLGQDVVLPKSYCDHALKGDWQDHRDLSHQTRPHSDL